MLYNERIDIMEDYGISDDQCSFYFDGDYLGYLAQEIIDVNTLDHIIVAVENDKVLLLLLLIQITINCIQEVIKLAPRNFFMVQQTISLAQFIDIDVAFIDLLLEFIDEVIAEIWTLCLFFTLFLYIHLLLQGKTWQLELVLVEQLDKLLDIDEAVILDDEIAENQ